MRHNRILLIFACILPAVALAQPVTVALWPKGAPQPPGFQPEPEVGSERRVEALLVSGIFQRPPQLNSRAVRSANM